MSKEQFLSFIKEVNTDAALQEKLKDAIEPDAVAAIAQSAGFESVSPDIVSDFIQYVAAQSTSEPEGEQELFSVSGGMSKVASAVLIGTAAGATILGVAGGVAGSYLAYQSRITASTFI